MKKNYLFLIVAGAIFTGLYAMNPGLRLIQLAQDTDDKLEEAFLLLGGNPEIVDVVDVNGWTALHHVANTNNIDFVRMLLNKNANWDLKNNEGKTARQIAVDNRKKHIDACRLHHPDQQLSEFDCESYDGRIFSAGTIIRDIPSVKKRPLVKFAGKKR